MLREVTNFVLEACERLHLKLSLNFYSASYQKDKFNIFSIHLKGRSVLNLTDKNFFDIPKEKRMREFGPLIREGLAHNLGEASIRDQVELPRRQGMNIIRDGVLIYGR